MKKFLQPLIIAVIFIAILGTSYFYYNANVDSLPPPVPSETNTPESGEAIMSTDFTVYDSEGNTVTLHEFEGKPVVLNFWASWCGPCKDEMPHFEDMYNKYGDEVEFLMVNLTTGRETIETATEYISDGGYTFPIYFDSDVDAAVKYSVTGIPTTYFIYPDKTVMGYYESSISAELLEQYISQIMM